MTSLVSEMSLGFIVQARQGSIDVIKCLIGLSCLLSAHTISLFQTHTSVKVEIHLLDTNDNSPAFLPSKFLTKIMSKSAYTWL